MIQILSEDRRKGATIKHERHTFQINISCKLQAPGHWEIVLGAKFKDRNNHKFEVYINKWYFFTFDIYLRERGHSDFSKFQIIIVSE